MAVQKKAKAPEPAGESAPMWIVSFADLVTLMMSFFVVLYALKQGGAQQQLETAVAFKETFDPSYTPPIDSVTPFDQLWRQHKGTPGPPHNNNGGDAPKPTDGAKGLDQNVTALRPDKQIVTGTLIDFDANSTTVDDEGRKAIQQIADKIRGLNNVLYVKGHVSPDELALRPDDPTGMNLSYQRASQVIDEFVKLGIDRKVMRPIACGSFEPLKTAAYDAATMKLNRRVEVFTTEYTASQFVPTQTVQATERAATEKPALEKPGAEKPGEKTLAHETSALTNADDHKSVPHP